MADEKMIKFRGNYMFTLPESIYKEFMKNKNKTEFLTSLITNYYDKNTINVKVDERIRSFYENDIYKDMRITMLLIDYYTKSNMSLQYNNFNSLNSPLNTISQELQKNENFRETAISLDNNESYDKNYIEKGMENSDDIDEDIESEDEENSILKVPENTVGSISSMFKKHKNT